MSKTRVYELAKELEIDAKDLIPRLEKLGIAVKSHSSTLEDDDVERARRELTMGERDKIVEKRVKATVIRRRAIRERAGRAISPEAAEHETPAQEEAALPPVEEVHAAEIAPPAEEKILPEEKRLLH